MNRIAILIDPWDFPFNGTVVSTRRFVAALRQLGYDIQLLAIAGEGSDSADGFQRLSIPGINPIIDAMRAPLARPDREKLRRLLGQCSLLHIQYPFFLANAALQEARSLGIPVICSFHVQPENILQNLRMNSRWLSRVLYRLFIQVFYARADRVIAPSAFAADLLRSHGLTTPISVLSNGIPARFFGVVRAPTENRFQILSVGRLAREKQQETLLRAIAQSSHADEIELILAGVGPRERYLSRLARDLGVRATIGWIEDDALLDLYGSADLFVHTGSIELEGMSVLEAMAAGNAVVVSDAPGSACATFNCLASSRFQSGNATDLALHIDYWFEHADERILQGRRNRQFARSHTLEESVEGLMAIYGEMADVVGIDGMASQLTGAS